MASKKQHILITGLPGIGKTTIVQRVMGLLKEKKVTMSGFLTEECRVDGIRCGFDIISIDGKRGILARKSIAEIQNSNAAYNNIPTVGQYHVDLASFESIALRTVKSSKHVDIYIIDEIGKMELFSKPFLNSIKELFSKTDGRIIATIPVPKTRPIPFVDTLRQRPDCHLFTVTKENRQQLIEEILEILFNET